MQKHKVYELIDQEGTIVNVGYTGESLEVRLHQHTKWKSHKWYGRKDLTIRLYASYNTKKEALATEGTRKLELGFNWMEIEGPRIAGRIAVESGQLALVSNKGGKASMAKLHICPNCSKQGNGPNMFKYHFNNCKLNPLKSS